MKELNSINDNISNSNDYYIQSYGRLKEPELRPSTVSVQRSLFSSAKSNNNDIYGYGVLTKPVRRGMGSYASSSASQVYGTISSFRSMKTIPKYGVYTLNTYGRRMPFSSSAI